MKRKFCVLLALLLALTGFSGCGKGGQEEFQSWHPAMAEYFGADETVQRQLAPACDFPDVTLSQDGVEISVLQTVMDGHAVHVLLQVKAEEVDGAPGFQSVWSVNNLAETFTAGQAIVCTPFAIAFSPYPTGQPGGDFQAVDPENGLYICQLYPSNSRRLTPGGVLLEFRDLSTQAGEGTPVETVQTGTWTVGWPMQFENVALRMVTEAMEIQGVSCPGLTVDVTPLAITVTTQAVLPQDVTLEVLLEDGASYSVTYRGVPYDPDSSYDASQGVAPSRVLGDTFLDGEDGYSRLYYRFPQTIDPSQVKEVRVGGQSIAYQGERIPQDFVVLAGREIPLDTTELDLSFCSVTDSEAEALRSLPQLTWLNMQFNRLTDLSFLEDLPNLEFLSLYNSQIQDFTPLSQLEHLKTLDLGSTGVSDLSFLEEMTSLESLFLRENQITDLSPLAGLTNLRELSLTDNPVTDTSVLDSLPNLENVVY